MPIKVVKFQEYRKNTLMGFFDVQLDNVGLEIRGCTVHQKGKSRWVGLPAKPYEDEDGTKKWSRIIDFYDEGRGKQFQKAVLQALDAYLADKKIDNFDEDKRNKLIVYTSALLGHGRPLINETTQEFVTQRFARTWESYNG